MTIVNGKAIAEEILKKIAKKKGKRPSLSVFMVGNDPASASFVKQKERAAKTAKINFKLFRLSSSVSQKKLMAAVKKESAKNPVIVQLPLPSKFRTEEILNAINKKNDADCMTESCVADILNHSHHLPPTVLALKKVLDRHKLSLDKKTVAIVGMGRLVGTPIYLWLMANGVNAVPCDKYTKNIFSIIKKVDVVISGVGKANFIKGKDIKKGAVLIDYGFSKILTSSGLQKITGDFEFSSCSKKAKLITPVPGGMGPITVAVLMENTSKIT
jgi:5,10-methylene-tetrahydrofolate dehydrogenase/methenyl tetrahydrofolate cyclohydrolase